MASGRALTRLRVFLKWGPTISLSLKCTTEGYLVLKNKWPPVVQWKEFHTS